MNEIFDFFTDQGISAGLAVAYIIVSVLLVIMAIAALVMWIMVAVRYMSTNRRKSSTGKTSFQLAREVLDSAGLNHIQVKRAGFIRAWVYGNYYDVYKKTIFLRPNISDKDSITAIGVALQKAGIAKMCEDGDKATLLRNKLVFLSIYGPLLFLPIVIIGAVLDILILNEIGAFSVIGIIIGLLFVIGGFVVTLLNIPVEKRANDFALKIIDDSGIFNSEERALIKKVFDTFIIAYILNFIVTVLRLVQLILEIIIKAKSSK